ncbi:MalY/PatB family protein [Leucothrix pacifica]|uniref:cysteine-S-conjugate beta-lyase n=1 Tax=Leucothrix pacifica TaxID=1247513 RepID=A0A317CDN1_9GAMM|nr:MalY/PatB family protein [Leucothrix pacifica]PWQ96489.1 aminotransferase [Leucothrix pacifica]
MSDTINFDEKIDRIGSHSMKWDMLQDYYGLDPEKSLPMWVADMDFRPPQSVKEALQGAVDHGVHGYFGDESAHHQAIIQWMQKRHQWTVDPSWISTTHGLVHGTALCVQAFTQPDDGVILFTPVYHAFARIIKANNRDVVESPLALVDGQYVMNLEALESQLKGHEKLMILCSPHNPGGRVWSTEELQAVAEFCQKHHLVLVSDEIHHDLVYPSAKHTVMPLAAPQVIPQLVMLTATTKTFNIAGGLTGNVIIQDPELRAQFMKAYHASGTSPNRYGVLMATAAYAHGEQWLDELLIYLDENRRLFDEVVNAIPGLSSMPMSATYLAWVDFRETGLSSKEVIERVQKQANIATNHGAMFGKGGEGYLRFNFACRRDMVLEAIERLKSIFA